MIDEWTDRSDRLLAVAIFGTDSAAEAERMIQAWARTRGFGDGRVSSVELSVGAAVTLQLATDKVFVKCGPVTPTQRRCQRNYKCRLVSAPMDSRHLKSSRTFRGL